MTKEIPQHKDILGKPLTIGCCVIFSSSNSLYIGTVVKINPKMVKVKRVNTKYAWEQNKYPSDLAVVEGAEVTMYLLKNSKTA